MRAVQSYMAAVFGALAISGSVEAAVLAGWDVNGVDLNDGIGIVTNVMPYAFYTTTSGVGHVEAVLTLGGGVNPSTSANQYGFKISASDQTNTLAGAIALNHYLEFSITVEAGYMLNLSSNMLYGSGSSTACSNVVLMTSVDGFVAGQEIASAYPANRTGGFDTDSEGFGGVIDLSDGRFQGLTGTISFRLYGWNSSSGSGVTYIRNWTDSNDLVVYGEVVPASTDGIPTLSMTYSNGVADIAIEFNGASVTNYVLQGIADLGNTNGWVAVSAPFSSSTNWAVETTNSAAFYRIVPE